MPRLPLDLPQIYTIAYDSSHDADGLPPASICVSLRQTRVEYDAVHFSGGSDQSRPPRVAQTPAQSDVWAFCLRGVQWEISMGDRLQAFRDKVGFHYLAELIRRPLEAIAAIELQATRQQQDPRVFGGSRGEVMSSEGFAALRARAKEAVEDLEDAREQGDIGSQERLRRELALIIQAIRSGSALGGGPRDLRDAERVRVAVTKGVHRAIWTIRQRAPSVADYFARTISTGTWLRFHPLGGEVWRVSP